ncbi:hypothetical protein EYF80_022377 [Liparis tanakae]|uniref:Uncharacterized protein n=1 Tax=Liparis tanakae TaxID=230148 RepID=A0A4Z2HPD0_9TELE|nr:hypothetical protein EYF80_022377 [Liparis tanakae]
MVRSRSDSLRSATPALMFLSSASIPKAAQRRLYSSSRDESMGTEKCSSKSTARLGFLTLVTPTLISSGPRETLMKQPGKSPSSLSSRSLPWCSVMWRTPAPWPGCLDGSNSSVTSSWPTV